MVELGEEEGLGEREGVQEGGVFAAGDEVAKARANEASTRQDPPRLGAEAGAPDAATQRDKGKGPAAPARDADDDADEDVLAAVVGEMGAQAVAQAPIDPPLVGAGANATARDAAKGKARAAVSAEGPPAFGEDDTDDDAPTGRTPAAAVASPASPGVLMTQVAPEAWLMPPPPSLAGGAEPTTPPAKRTRAAPDAADHTWTQDRVGALWDGVMRMISRDAPESLPPYTPVDIVRFRGITVPPACDALS